MMGSKFVWASCALLCWISFATPTTAKIIFHRPLVGNGFTERWTRRVLESDGPADVMDGMRRKLARYSSRPTAPPCLAPKQCVLETGTRCIHDGTSPEDSKSSSSPSRQETWAPSYYIQTPQPTSGYPQYDYDYDNTPSTCSCDCTCSSTSRSGGDCSRTCMDAKTCEAIAAAVAGLMGGSALIACCIAGCCCFAASKKRASMVVFPQQNPGGMPQANGGGPQFGANANGNTWLPTATTLPEQGGQNMHVGAMQQQQQQPMQGMMMQQPMQGMQMQQQPIQGMMMQQPMQGTMMQQPMQGMTMQQQPILQGMTMQQAMQGTQMQQPMQGMQMQQPMQGMPMQQPMQGMQMQQQGPMMVTATPVKASPI